jgi:hypothetical protein
LNHINESKRIAENAVSDGDETLRKANSTYQLLQDFQSEVQKSSKSAKIALEDVPHITKQMDNTQNIIQKNEEVTMIFTKI